MRKSSREVFFVNTSPPGERVELLKPMSEIEGMQDECEEIHSGGLLKRYAERPALLQNVTLAGWAAWYDSSSKHYQKKSNASQIDLDNLPTESLIDDETNDDYFCDNNTTDKLKTKSGIKKRTNSRILRSVWFNREAQPEKHYRELLMLFTPWRNEETDLISHYTSFQEHYLARYDEIGEQMKQYAVCSEDVDEIQQHLNDDNEDQFGSIAAVTQDTELQDEDVGNQDLHPDLNEQYDMSEDIGIPSTTQNNKPLILHEMQDDEYRGMVQSLNKKKKEFFQHALHFIKTSDNPFYAFLSGGGGVGKSHLIW